MKWDRPNVTYTFVDPNTPREAQKALKLMIIEKLMAEKERNGDRLAEERSGQ